MKSFWKDIKKNYDTRLPLHPWLINVLVRKIFVICGRLIHKKLLNIVDSSKSKESV